MDTEIILATDNRQVIMPSQPDKVTRSRLGQYVQWLDQNNLQWFKPDLIGYRDYLLTKNNSNSVSSKLSTIRSRYEALTRNRDLIYSLIPSTVESVADRKATADEIIQRIINAIDPNDTKVDVTTKQDKESSEHIRLTLSEANRLLSKPDTSSLSGLRDKAVIGLMLATGIRENELSNLDVTDLRVLSEDNVLCLRVTKGKGNKSRLIPYGQMIDVLQLVDKWLNEANISSGSVFRGFYKGGAIRDTRLKVRAIQYILSSYSIIIQGSDNTVKPHDLRRSYARLMYDAGMDITAIRDNLGHEDIRTTQGYIGQADMSKRQPSIALKFN